MSWSVTGSTVQLVLRAESATSATPTARRKWRQSPGGDFRKEEETEKRVVVTVGHMAYSGKGRR